MPTREETKVYNARWYALHKEEYNAKRRLENALRQPSPEQKLQNHHKRFWSHVAIKTPEECWVWQLRLIKGYGTFTSDHRTVFAHRYSWELHYGNIPEGLKVLHKCDNRACVNPNHLFLGTSQQNMDDMMAKGRANPPIGERSGTARLNSKSVLEIRAMYKTGNYTYADLAKLFDVVAATIGDIVRGKIWKHLL